MTRRQRRLKLLDKNNELRQEVDPEYNYGTYGQGDLEEWIEERIPTVPPGTLCESKRCVTLTTCGEEASDRFCVHAYNHEGDCLFVGPHAQERHCAESYVWVITDGHVCYTYVCWECSELSSDYDSADPRDYPTTDAGYAISPTHCN